ncbi:RNA 2',3'-cyclic phosphodiesterase [Caproiciproducens sp.]|uniref:RNA 2',3'-cyclic phosphodiesterase n=1 Tax=Caproiciproducens sp. TaxID=1954376 RepID=UPI00289944CF|nr:RNA 2',3'-cyclic phosphodiesterase [Caproiciproducens sp.]
MNSLRLFISINFDDRMKDSLYGCIQRLKEGSVRGNFTRRENLHLTLAFLGETSKAGSAKQAMDDVAGEPFELSIGGFGHFPRAGGDIYWIGVEHSTALTALQASLCEKLRREGFFLETRQFKPHLTLGREVVPAPDFDRGAFARSVPPMSMNVEKISLMKSEKLNGRLTYTEIYAKQLGETVRARPSYRSVSISK